jgi:UDPglucose 6-dehydrogenase
MPKPKISVMGLGFVGLTLAVVNADKGFSTVGIDIDKEKIKKLQKGETTFYEPNLKKMLKKNLNNELILTDQAKEIIKTDITFLTVGTPSTSSGKIELSHLKKAISQIIKILETKKSRHLLVIKSTIIPSTTLNTILPKFKELKKIGVVVNPEFLREGNAIKDLLEPHLIVIGESSKKDGDILERYYKIFYKKSPEIIRTDLSSAEMIKYANNAFLATKISFINSIANIAQNIPNVDVNKIAYAIGKDSRIGPQFLNAGPGFGGSCLPKDLAAFIKFSDKYGKINSLFKAVKNVNSTQPIQIIKLLENMNLYKKDITISILGLAFKKNTDDVREAVSIKLIKKLLLKKINIKVHDPMAINNIQKIFKSKINYFNSVKECMSNSDVCIILTEWDEYKKIDQQLIINSMKRHNIIDARRILSPEKFSKINFKAIGLNN